MRNTTKLMIIAAVGMLSSVATQAYSQDRQTLFGSSANRTVKFKRVAPYRVDDKGNVLSQWRQQVVFRAVNNTNVYQYRANATARHDEVSSSAVLIHTKGSGLRNGHVYRTRGN